MKCRLEIEPLKYGVVSWPHTVSILYRPTCIFCSHNIFQFSLCKCPACSLVVCCTLSGASLLVNKAPAQPIIFYALVPLGGKEWQEPEMK